MKKVLLLSMPYGALERQALGLSLLKAELMQQNIQCDIRYLTFPFAEFIGCNEYQWMTYDLPYTAFAGEWTFTQALYGERPDVDKDYIEEILNQKWQLDPSAVQRILRIRSFVPHFLAYCMEYITWEEYAIVGFTSTFEQNIASLSLAKQIKAAYPEIAIIFGGANWEGEMGIELHRQFEFVDFVCSGEADESFSMLVERILTGESQNGFSIPGLVFRAGSETICAGKSKPVTSIDNLPVPDYSDYFHDLEQCTVGASIVPVLLLETARGCWWGEKSHCAFCGLTGESLAFRSKDAKRALNEIEYLVDRWQLDFIEVVDNILDMKYFNTLLPALASLERSISLFYEVKANLSRKQVQILSKAGVKRIQPGIESLSDHVLKLMRKGTTALQNIQTLKYCIEQQIYADWNILFGFPGETQEDYEKMLDLFHSIRFFKPPTGCGPIRLDRFSPYFNDPASFGFTNLRPLSPYKYLYPFDEKVTQRIAYYFDYDYLSGLDPTGIAKEVALFVRSWQKKPEQGSLCSVYRPDRSLVLLDTRSCAVQPQYILSKQEQAVYEYCADIRSTPAIQQHLQELLPELENTGQEINDMLTSFVYNRLMVTDGVHYLSLALAALPVHPAFELYNHAAGYYEEDLMLNHK
jgi:ribosomal peptide maturation radical SAM protein 1